MWARAALGAFTSGAAGVFVGRRMAPRPDWSDLEAATDARAEKWLLDHGVHRRNAATIVEQTGYNLEDLRRVALACKGAAFYEAVDDAVETLVREKEAAVETAAAEMHECRAHHEEQGTVFATPPDEVIRVLACNAIPATGPFYFDDRADGTQNEILMGSDALRSSGLVRLDHKTTTYTVTNRLVHEAMQRYTSKP